MINFEDFWKNNVCIGGDCTLCSNAKGLSCATAEKVAKMAWDTCEQQYLDMQSALANQIETLKKAVDKVYITTEGQYSDRRIFSVSTTKEKAYKDIRDNYWCHREINGTVHEYLVDDTPVNNRFRLKKMYIEFTLFKDRKDYTCHGISPISDIPSSRFCMNVAVVRDTPIYKRYIVRVNYSNDDSIMLKSAYDTLAEYRYLKEVEEAE